jgi:MazG family protein
MANNRKKNHPIERLLEVMRILRDPLKGCPWDKEQSFASVAPYTIEEAYEVEEAIRKEDFKELKEELGDLLLQVVFHSQIAAEIGLFDFDQVVMGICKKMIRRHPHVFQGRKSRDVHSQGESWELQKAEERKQKSFEQGRQLKTLDNVALALPALMRAQKLSKRAARVGFDWPSSKVAWKKVEEEICEMQEEFQTKASTSKNLQEEFGDLLFALCSWARKSGIDAEVALRDANSKFIHRFEYVEERVNHSEESWEQFSLENLMEFWDESKKR